MQYNVPDFIRDVRVVLDRNMQSDALSALSDVDTLSLEEIIRSKVVDSVRAVIMDAPKVRLGVGVPFGESIAWDTQEGIGSGYVLLPPDFLRLVAFQMTDWRRACYEAITPTDPKYTMQKSQFPGIKGNPDRPVVALVNKPIGMALEFYSCMGGQGTAIAIASYIPEPRIIDEKIHIPHLLKDAAVYHAAYLTAVTMEEIDQAQKLLDIRNSLMQ